jgi:hypothetical protein
MADKTCPCLIARDVGMTSKSGAEAMRIILGIIFLVSVVMSAVAGGHNDDPNHDRFERQRNSAGKSCCQIADGHRVDDADWKSDGAGHYQVGLDGKWIPVPDAAIINPHDRPIDYAVVWIWHGEILCSMPGSGS